VTIDSGSTKATSKVEPASRSDADQRACPLASFRGICQHCARVKLVQRCARCKTALYCSASCQKADWSNGHKSVCKSLAEQFVNLPALPVEPPTVATPDTFQAAIDASLHHADERIAATNAQ